MQDDLSTFRTIRLIPNQEADGRWRCQFMIIVENGVIPTDQRIGYPEETYATLAEAVAAAKMVAQCILDPFKSAA